MPLSENVRRVVTVVDDHGKAVVLFDGDNPHKLVRANRNSVSRLLWMTDRSPAAVSGTADRAAVSVGIAPPAGGSIFRIVEFPPITPEVERLDPDNMHGELAPACAPKRGQPPPASAHAPPPARSDYAIVMEGEIDMLLDDSEILLKAGDVLIQQGTHHAWGQSRHPDLPDCLRSDRRDGAVKRLPRPLGHPPGAASRLQQKPARPNYGS